MCILDNLVPRVLPLEALSSGKALEEDPLASLILGKKKSQKEEKLAKQAKKYIYGPPS